VVSRSPQQVVKFDSRGNGFLIDAWASSTPTHELRDADNDLIHESRTSRSRIRDYSNYRHFLTEWPQTDHHTVGLIGAFVTRQEAQSHDFGQAEHSGQYITLCIPP
jgi:hypothetical protein